MSQTHTATAFDSLRRAFEAAYNNADADALGQLFTEDAVLMPPEGPNPEGRGAISEHYRDWWQRIGPATLSITTDEVRQVGDLTLGRGAWKATRSAGSEGPAAVGGKYLNLSVTQPDGSLKLFRHIVNMAPPAS
jgi:uncharacterized protein (TIGR02246 family)